MAGSPTAGELDAWDERLAAAAAELVVRRQGATAALIEAFEESYQALRGAAFPRVAVTYRGESWLNGSENLTVVEESYRKRYNETRVRDRHAGHTQEGPHRHDLCILARIARQGRS